MRCVTNAIRPLWFCLRFGEAERIVNKVDIQAGLARETPQESTMQHVRWWHDVGHDALLCSQVPDEHHLRLGDSFGIR